MRIIQGHSTDSSIEFISENSKVVIHSDYTAEFFSYIPSDDEKLKQYKEKSIKDREEMIERSKEVSTKNIFKKLRYFVKRKTKQLKKKIYDWGLHNNHPFTKTQKIILPVELILIILSIILKIKIVALSGVTVALIYNFYYFIKVAMLFYKNETLRKNHAAEHKAFNCFNNHKLLTIENIRNSSTYSEYCGSSKFANEFFLEFINLFLALFLGVWIPHTVIIYLSLNMQRAFKLNLFARLYQLFLTKKPDTDNLLLAQVCVAVLDNVDYASQSMEITPAIFKSIIDITVKQLADLT